MFGSKVFIVCGAETSILTTWSVQGMNHLDATATHSDLYAFIPVVRFFRLHSAGVGQSTTGPCDLHCLAAE